MLVERDIEGVGIDVAFHENFKHKVLKPLEAGRAVSMMMAQVADDVAAVAAKVGQTVHWVQTHARIERGLIRQWKEASIGPRFSPWSAGHWIVIARQPIAAQEKLLKQMTGDGAYGAEHWAVERIEQRISAKHRPLAEAPFDTAACLAECDKRTGFCPSLWGDVGDAGEAGDECLEPKCWDGKASKHAKAEFGDLCVAKTCLDAVPLSMIAPKDDTGSGQADYKEKIQPVKKLFGKGLVEVCDVEIVKKPKGWDTGIDRPEGVKAAIVVAGRGKGAVKFFRVPKREKGEKSEKRAEAARWQQVELRVVWRIVAVEQPSLAMVAILFSLREGDCPSEKDVEDRLTGVRTRLDDPAALEAWAAELLWKEWTADVCPWNPFELPELVSIGTLLGIEIDPQAMYDEIVAGEEKGAKGEKGEKGEKGQKSEKAPKGAAVGANDDSPGKDGDDDADDD